ncbi:MAG: anti-sigma factor family protein, partial [Acetobacteraceae bacterium]
VLRRLATAQAPVPPPRQAPWQTLWQGMVRRWREALAFGGGAAVAAAVVLLLVLPGGGGEIAQDVASAHIRALQPGHLMDVVSTDQHTVKPWFDGRLDFAPPVKDLAAQGFPLIGGRLDYLDGHPAAALVYRRAKHLIDLYVWPAQSSTSGGPTAPRTGERNGYHLVHWRQDGMQLWAVSDVEAAQLRAFVRDWRAMR